VAELRSRAGTLIDAAAITTSFLGGRILSSHRLHPLAWAAIGCFAFVGITLLALLWPWRDWRLTVNAQSFIQTYLEPSDAKPLELPAIHRDLALHVFRTARLQHDRWRSARRPWVINPTTLEQVWSDQRLWPARSKSASPAGSVIPSLRRARSANPPACTRTTCAALG
jgi:hypothetical protein